MKKKISLLIMSVLSLTLILSGCSTEKPNEEAPVETEEKVEVRAENEEVKEGIFTGDKIYDFTLEDIDGNEISISDYKGKVLMLNFWASWCPPCKAEMPHMEKVYNELKGEDFDMLTVNLTTAEKNGRDGANKFINDMGYTFPVVYDVDGKVADKFRITGIPTTYIINKEGIISSFIKAPLDEKGIKREIEKAME